MDIHRSSSGGIPNRSSRRTHRWRRGSGHRRLGRRHNQRGRHGLLGGHWRRYTNLSLPDFCQTHTRLLTRIGTRRSLRSNLRRTHIQVQSGTYRKTRYVRDTVLRDERPNQHPHRKTGTGLLRHPVNHVGVFQRNRHTVSQRLFRTRLFCIQFHPLLSTQIPQLKAWSLFGFTLGLSTKSL